VINSRFYDKSLIKPGYGFYKALIEANKEIPLKYLHGINIPSFLITIKNDTFFVYQGTKGFVIDAGVNLVVKFDDHVLETTKWKYKEHQDIPIMINRRKDDFDQNPATWSINVKSYKDLREKKEFLPPDYSIRQKFVITKGRGNKDFA